MMILLRLRVLMAKNPILKQEKKVLDMREVKVEEVIFQSINLSLILLSQIQVLNSSRTLTKITKKMLLMLRINRFKIKMKFLQRIRKENLRLKRRRRKRHLLLKIGKDIKIRKLIS